MLRVNPIQGSRFFCAIRQEKSVRLFFFCILECKHYEHYDGHEITQRAAGAEVSRGCGRAGNHAALRYDGDGGTGGEAGAVG